MKFFLDTANLDKITYFTGLGLVNGVTTNPSLIAKEGKEFLPTIKEILKIVDGPVSVEVIGSTSIEMIKEAREFSKLAKNVVVKIPFTKEGVKATQILNKENVKVNMTLVFSASQALIAAKSGASYVSPFVGRLDDISHEGMELVEQIKTIFDNYNFKTEIIVASIRSPKHVVEAAMLGADIATIPPDVLELMFNHPLTDVGIKKFMKDWGNAFST
ncbi:MAG TPA: fructose-6-phosphate aldolase [Desulfurella acetivorans]|uniref:Probable transaldolase n=1 Tax=Desulfurella acetivorans TaxID=33002 RepID=A0A7C6A8B4_DESAE|nr:fructose-6-phosphate aldolase [Desulfurella acetivorans]